MSLTEIEYDKVNAFSNLLIDYNLNNSHFSDLISNFPTLDNLNKQISFKSKNYNNQFRESLVKEIGNQYKGIKLSEIQKQNINKLLEKDTYTITTGHQLNLLTGPLYFIYKIISTINLSETLKKELS
ncbi:MAG: bacillithiol biosynthesis BshC [Flavobacteriaceae bacterium]